jgi:spermidine/putrescine-binding protein
MTRKLPGAPMTRRTAAGLLGGATLAAALLQPGLARAQGATLNFLGWQGYDDPIAFDDFLASKGITLNPSYIGNNDEIVAKLRAGGVGQIDVVTPYMGYVPLLAKLDLIQPIDVARVPNLEHVMPIFRNDPNINLDGQLYGIPFTWGGGPMMYDPAVIPTPPARWRDLLNPEFAGKVGMMDDPLGNIMIAALVAVPGAASPTRLSPPELEAAIDFLVQVKAQSRLFAPSFGDLADAMARGDVAITFNGWETMVKFAADKGKTIAYTYPEERTNAWLDNYCIAKDAPNLDAAYEVLNRVISLEGQTRVATNLVQAITSQQAVEALPTDLRTLYPYDDIASFEKKAGFFGFPPTEATEGLATFPDWLRAYERFKAA